ncbi:MAG: TIGR01212 family radical SAM protein [Bacilli bacterium]
MNSKQFHPYNYLDAYLKRRFNAKTIKITLNGQFSCPNRDGTISTLGCLFCSEKGSGDFAGNPLLSLKDQFLEVKTRQEKKWSNAKYIAYFQANTNTYGPLEKIKNLCEEAITLDDQIVAISLATRCDCLNNEILDYLESLNKRIPVWIELGLQTSNDETKAMLNLGYNNATFLQAVKSLNDRHIEVIVHIINGLPNETKDMMLKTIDFINHLPIQGLKIHNLVIIKNTPLGYWFMKNPFPMLSLTEYLDILSDQIAKLNPNIVIHRISGDAPHSLLIAPKWSQNKKIIINELDKTLFLKHYHQGSIYEKRCSQ